MNKPVLSKNTRTTAQILEQQKADAAARKAANVLAPAKATGTAVAVPDTRTDIEKYIDTIAPSMIAGRLIKFDGKVGQFSTVDDGEPLADDTEFIALCGEVLIGWVKFRGEGEQPDRICGLLYDGFVMPARETLGNNDPNDWPAGLTGQPQGPWLHQILLPLQHTGTHELFTFSSTSITGRRAIGTLLRSFDRMRRANPGLRPVIRLKVGGFNHRDERIGWVNVPVLVIVGRAGGGGGGIKREPKPDTSVKGDMQDELPW